MSPSLTSPATETRNAPARNRDRDSSDDVLVSGFSDGMPTLNFEYVGRALQILVDGLAPFVEDRLQAVFQDKWQESALGSLRTNRPAQGGGFAWDAHSLLTVMWDQWNVAFRDHLGHTERSLVSELREFRNRWAHQQPMDFDDTYRVVDSVRRLLVASQADNLRDIRGIRGELLEAHVGDMVNKEVQRTEHHRNKWWVIVLYAICCLAIAWQLVDSELTGSSALVSLVLLVFFYLIYQQFKFKPPILYGPRACPRCKKIIYRKTCPYCS